MITHNTNNALLDTPAERIQPSSLNIVDRYILDLLCDRDPDRLILGWELSDCRAVERLVAAAMLTIDGGVPHPTEKGRAFNSTRGVYKHLGIKVNKLSPRIVTASLGPVEITQSVFEQLDGPGDGHCLPLFRVRHQNTDYFLGFSLKDPATIRRITKTNFGSGTSLLDLDAFKLLILL